VEAGWAPGPVWTEEKNTQINRDSISGTDISAEHKDRNITP